MNKTFKYAAIRKELEVIQRGLSELSEGNFQHYAWIMARLERLEEIEPELARRLQAECWDAVN